MISNRINWIFRTFLKGTTLKERTIWKIDLEKDSIELTISKLKTTITRGNKPTWQEIPEP